MLRSLLKMNKRSAIWQSKESFVDGMEHLHQYNPTISKRNIVKLKGKKKEATIAQDLNYRRNILAFDFSPSKGWFNWILDNISFCLSCRYHHIEGLDVQVSSTGVQSNSNFFLRLFVLWYFFTNQLNQGLIGSIAE